MIEFFKRTRSNQELRLFEILKLKKSLETLFLKGGSFGFGNYKLKLKAFILTQKLDFFFINDIHIFLVKIQDYLAAHFKDCKQKGEQFEISNINSIEHANLPFFTELVMFHKQLEKHDSALVIQGSYADGTYLSYSDVDLVIIGILSDEVRKIKLQIDKFLLTLDPLQHHGTFFILKDSFLNYWQMDLPIATLKKSILLSSASTLKISAPFYFKERYSAYYWLSNFINGNKKLPVSINSGAFIFKYFLSQLMLVPALLLAYRGNYVYKKESFTLAKQYYSSQAWKCMLMASDLRTQWDQGNISHKYSTDRESSASFMVEEYNTVPDVVNVEAFSFEEFDKSYKSFIKETDHLINEL